MGITEAMWKQSKKVDFGSELDAAQAEAKAWKTIWSAGQGVTSISDIKSVAQLTEQLKVEFKIALEAQNEKFRKYFNQ